MQILDYAALVADFETKLVTQLRSFGAGAEYLEMWVPDEDPVKSLLNMVEAAAATGCDTLAVRISGEELSALQIKELAAKVAGLGRIEVSAESDGMLLVVARIEGTA